MHIQPQFSIFLINKPGVLGAVTSALAKAGVNLYALSLSDSGEHGCLRVVCSEPDRAREVLKETHDRWTETDVLVMTIGNEPGAFARITDVLAGNNVNITYAYCTAEEAGGKTTAVFKIQDIDRAKELLASF